MIEWNEFYRKHAPYFDNRANFETNSISYYEYLGKIRQVLIEFFKEYDRFQKEMNENFDEYVELKNAEINKIIETIKKEVFEDNIELFNKWLDENMDDIIHESMQIVWFGLEGDYFAAYIPKSWSEITFDSTENGELVLVY